MRSIKTVFDGRELVFILCMQYDTLEYVHHILALTFGAYSYLNKRQLRSITLHINSNQDYWIDIDTYKPDKINYQKFYLVALAIAEKFKIYHVRAAYRIFDVDTLTYREISSGALKKTRKRDSKRFITFLCVSTGG